MSGINIEDCVATSKSRRIPKAAKEINFVAEYLANGGNGTKAALKAYDCSNSNDPKKTASVIASGVLGRFRISDAFEQSGLSTQRLATEVTRIALGATKRDAVTEALIPDNDARLRALKSVADLMGVRQDPKKAQRDDYFSFVRLQRQEYGFED